MGVMKSFSEFITSFMLFSLAMCAECVGKYKLQKLRLQVF